MINNVHGHVMYLDRDDAMGIGLHGTYEPVETKLVTELVRPGMIVFDIGANIGYHTLLFAKLAGPDGHVFAFEPDPYSYSLLVKNIEANKYTNVSAYPLAVTDQAKQLKLYRSSLSNLDHRIVAHSQTEDTISIKGVKLDEFPDVSDCVVDFIKMDIQSAEGWALEGMKDIVSRSKNVMILTEFWPAGLEHSQYGAEKFLRQLASMGFELVDVKDDVGSAPESIEQLTKRYPSNLIDHTNLLCLRKR